eukprot:GHVU01105200.1.p1 GENE.GHVU01105200.1~~GHVU01105200.1.p1  ORF type:complete len:105 (+),score=4.67 GHVU01105200.1:293-607(+)
MVDIGRRTSSVTLNHLSISFLLAVATITRRHRASHIYINAGVFWSSTLRLRPYSGAAGNRGRSQAPSAGGCSTSSLLSHRLCALHPAFFYMLHLGNPAITALNL